MQNSTLKNKSNPYLKFIFMMIISFVVMYFIMFLNVAQYDHVYNSLTRLYMTLLMIATMAITMILFMWRMYPNHKTNYLIIASSSVIFFVTLYLLRTQTPITDVQWMKAMIPHHSSAIMTSSNAKFENEKVQQLAKDIIEAQKREIDMMKKYINEIENQ